MAIYTVQTPENKIYLFLRRVCALRCYAENGGDIYSRHYSRGQIKYMVFDDDLYEN